jgi:hypothetical protein
MSRDMRQTLAYARALGCTVQPVMGTGETEVRHPSQAKPLRVNGRRKDAPRELTGFVVRVARALDSGGPSAR